MLGGVGAATVSVDTPIIGNDAIGGAGGAGAAGVVSAGRGASLSEASRASIAMQALFELTGVPFIGNQAIGGAGAPAPLAGAAAPEVFRRVAASTAAVRSSATT